MNELIRKAARKWFYESFDCDLLAQMQEKGLIDQAEGFSVSVMAELELEMENAFLSFQVELGAMKAERDALQQRLTVAEQRSAELESAAREMLRIAAIANQGSNAYNRAIINLHSALKLAEEGEGS